MHMVLMWLLFRSGMDFTRVKIRSKEGENMIKGGKGVKVKVIFQGLHMTFVSFFFVDL
jgi:hypothetical protein